jgi:hypothetical protein
VKCGAGGILLDRRTAVRGALPLCEESVRPQRTTKARNSRAPCPQPALGQQYPVGGFFAGITKPQPDRLDTAHPCVLGVPQTGRAEPGRPRDDR